tara:strand:+ start:160 stop:657 length:498 start_codon:yes stop_codon:yes gene_type:complete
LIDLKEIKNKILKKENLNFLLLILIIFSLDRYSKIEIIKNFSDEIFYYNNFLNLDLIWNTGIGFGLLSSDSVIFYNLISGVIVLVIILLIIVALGAQKFDKLIFSIIIGGALGNFYDRLIYQAVPDFIDLHYKNFHWFTFNVADIFITFGILSYLLIGMFKKNNE